MKKVIRKYQISKFKRFMNGLLFAIISLIAVIQCLVNIAQPSSQENLIMAFLIAIISMFMGLFSMFHDGNSNKVTEVR